MSVLSSYLNHNYAKGDAQRDAGLATPKDIRRYDDLSYGPDRKWQLLDIYRPKDCEDLLPVILIVHGGAWIYGDKDTYQYYGMSLAQRGFAVVNFTYHLAPQFRYPAQIEDIDLVMTFIKENAEQYRLDLNNIFAAGDSAGGQLLSAYTALLKDEQYRSYYDIDLQDELYFNAIALNCGVYHVENRRHDQVFPIMKEVLKKGFSTRDLQMFNTFDKVTDSFPPVFLMSCEGDYLLDQVNYLQPSLQAHGIPYELHIYGDETNILWHDFHINIRLKDAEICNSEECAFFRKYMKGNGQ